MSRALRSPIGGLEGTISLERGWVWMAHDMTRPSRLELKTPYDLEVDHFHEALFRRHTLL